uniref:Nucleolar complex protein 14 n=1 Tax=Candidozyma auris TaxID=498019 RepID=A0A0L0NQA2_CANAR
MAGSQLKQLKAALKAKGLVGQTNVKKKNKKSAPSETRKDQEEKKRALGQIHDDFNLFDNKINRAKHDYTIIQGGKFVKAGSKQHNDVAKSKSGLEKALKMNYEADKKLRGRAGGLVDRRFGEKNKNLTEEEKMLERFTRERQASLKKNMFSLESDDEYDDDGLALTHSGKALSFEQDFDEGDLGVSDKRYVDEDSEQPPKKKSKKDVMAEIIAKSKYYKKQRQMEFQKTQDEIMDLDDEFGDVLLEMNKQKAANNAFKQKSQQDIEYDQKIRELTYDRRAVPADRTKTEEELTAEHEERMKKLEADRLKRMDGLHEDRPADADDLDDDFWECNSENEADGFQEESDSGEEESSESEEESSGRRPKTPAVSMPISHGQLLEHLEDKKGDEVISHFKKISEVYHPRLAAGNKEKMDNFVGIIFEHILHISDQEEVDAKLVDDLTKLLRTMAEKYNQALVETVRTTLEQIKTRVVKNQVRKSDLVCFVILGYVFSASDHYHLVITPALIIMNQFLNNEIGETHIENIGKGLFICDVLLQYQFYAKRYYPEVIKFLERALTNLLPEPKKLVDALDARKVDGKSNLDKKFHSKTQPRAIRVLELFEVPDAEAKFNFIARAFTTIDRIVGMWKEKSAFLEILHPLMTLSKHALRYFSTELPQLQSLVERMSKLESNLTKSRKPLTLQEHRQLAIKTFAPKFEENFNPDKKLYDENRDRQELNKIKAQIKKEKKGALKDLRKQTRFVARQQISEKKEMYSAYHRKMANIVNTISTEEGAEKNLYERERKKRKNQK